MGTLHEEYRDQWKILENTGYKGLAYTLCAILLETQMQRYLLNEDEPRSETEFPQIESFMIYFHYFLHSVDRDVH